MKKITFVKDIETDSPLQTKKLWRGEEGYVLTSAIDSPNRGIYEAMAFRSDEKGEVIQFTELGRVHSLDHEAALADAGYDNILS